ncbi:MAG: hypothetical protein ACI8PB_004277 [Desulforhopalus sp.]|jgi:hypothetical protein
MYRKILGEKKMKSFILSILFMLMLSACGSVNVQTEIGAGADFAKLGSFGWLEKGDVALDGVEVRNPDVDKWVKASVEKQLQSKGYKKATNNQPDFLVSWIGAIEKKVKVDSIEHFYSSYGYGPVAAGMPLEAKKGDTVREYEEGTILLDVLDPINHTMLWRGRGTDRLLQGMEKGDAALYVDRVVKNILKTFPTVKK